MNLCLRMMIEYKAWQYSETRDQEMNKAVVNMNVEW